MLMQSPNIAEKLRKQRNKKSQERRQKPPHKSSRNLKIALAFGIMVEALTLALVVWIIHLDVMQATKEIPFVAAIFTIVSTPVIMLLAYFQWRHPASSEGSSSQGQDTSMDATPQVPIVTKVSMSSSSNGHNNSCNKPVNLSSVSKEPAQSMKVLEAGISSQLPDTRPLLLISFNDADRQMAEWINWQLLEEGYKTTLRADFVPGSNPTLMMDETLKQMRHALIILSPEYLKKNQEEWANIFRTDPTGRNLTLIPIYIQDCTKELAKGFLGGIAAINLVGKNNDDARKILLTEIGRSVGGKKMRFDEPPPFPNA